MSQENTLPADKWTVNETNKDHQLTSWRGKPEGFQLAKTHLRPTENQSINELMWEQGTQWEQGLAEQIHIPSSALWTLAHRRKSCPHGLCSSWALGNYQERPTAVSTSAHVVPISPPHSCHIGRIWEGLVCSTFHSNWCVLQRGCSSQLGDPVVSPHSQVSKG